MTSFWSMWKMFCDVQTKMKIDDEQCIVAIIPMTLTSWMMPERGF